MTTLRLRVTNKVAGELVLPTLGPAIALKAGQEVAVTEKQYWSEDIQRCLDPLIGKLELVAGKPVEEDEGFTKTVYIRSLRDGTLVLPSIPKALKLGEMYGVPLRHYQNNDIQQALSRGFIEEVKPRTVAKAIVAMEKEAKAAQVPQGPTAVKLPPTMQPNQPMDPAEEFYQTGRAKVQEGHAKVQETAHDPRPGQTAQQMLIALSQQAQTTADAVKRIPRAARTAPSQPAPAETQPTPAPVATPLDL